MSVSKAYTLYCATIGANFLDQMENQNYDAGIEEMLIQANGSIYNQFAAIGLQQPKLDFTTSNLFAALAQGLLGYEIGAGLTNTSAAFYFRQFQAQGGFLGGSVQLKMAMTLGSIFPRKLSARTGERATLDMEVFPIFDGTNSPFVITNNVALPTGSPAISHVHTAGPAIINGVAIEGIQSIDVDFGIKEQLLKSDGEAFNSFIGTPSVSPSITLETYDMSVLSSLGAATNISSSTELFLVGIQPGGTRIPYTTANHIGMGMTAGMIYVTEGSAKNGEVGTIKIKIIPIFDGTNAPITFNTATAITLP
ncbi:MAG: hypothetical protein WCL60_01345 [Methylococcales bacterium]